MIIRLLFLTATLLAASHAWGQKKMDLDDLKIKGDLLGDDRIQMIKREKNKLKNYVQFRTNYRKEMIQGLTKPHPRYKE